MQTQFTIPRAAVRALLHLAGKGDIRGYLNGVHCEVTDRQTIMAATNGHVMGVYRHACPESDPNTCGAPFTITIPRDALESIGAKGYPALIVRARDDGRYEIHDPAADTSRAFAALEGKFPDWRRVMPRSAPTLGAEDLPFAQFDPDYIAAFAKVAKALQTGKGRPYVNIGHRGQKDSACVEISGHPEFFGVLMPLRTSRADIPRVAPEWCREPMPTAAPISAQEPANDPEIRAEVAAA
jgi:DNA polymerase-3 subunit beta